MATSGKRADGAGDSPRIIERDAAETAEIYGPPQVLATTIAAASKSIWLELSHTFGYSTSDAPAEPSIYLFFECLYFFVHLARRLASGKGYSAHQVAALQEFLVPLLTSVAIDAFFSQWPDEAKARIASGV